MFRIILASFLLSFSLAVYAQETEDKLINALKNDSLEEAMKIVRERMATQPSSRMRLAEKILNEASRRGPGDHQRIEARADAAQLAGSCPTAIVLYQQAIDGLESHYEKYLRPHGRKYWVPYNVMYKAAACAFRLGDHPRAFSYLQSIEKYGDTWVKKLGEDKSKALREFSAAPRTTSTSIKFARDFWTGNVPAVASTYYDLEDFLNQTLVLNPITREQTKEILLMMHTTARSLGDLDELDRQVKRLTNAFGVEDFVMEAVLDIATKLTTEKRFADSEIWLKWLTEHGKDNPRFIIQVAVTRANIAESNGDEATMLRELLSAFNTPAVGRGFVGVPSHDHYVTKRLARYYKKTGNYAEALKYFTALVPGGSGCGNCNAEMRYERDLGIGECLIKLGRADEALERHLMPYLTPTLGGASPDVARLVVSVHEKRGVLEGFVTWISPLVANGTNHAAQTALRMAQIRLSGQKGEIEKLVSEIRHTGSHNLRIRFEEDARRFWEPVAIAEALADQNGREFPAIKKRYEQLKPAVGEEANGSRIWLIYALGVSRAPEAEAYLRELLAAKEYRDEISFALSMKKSK